MRLPQNQQLNGQLCILYLFTSRGPFGADRYTAIAATNTPMAISQPQLPNRELSPSLLAGISVCGCRASHTFELIHVGA